MTIKINYKTNIQKKLSSNYIFFVDEKFNINGLKKYISNSEIFLHFRLIKK
jgi:leucyl aminopeptidase